VRVYPPPGEALLPAAPGPVVITGGDARQQDADLPGIAPLPAGMTLSPSRQTGAGVPLVNWRQETQLALQGCSGGSATYQVLQAGSAVLGGALAEGPAGQYGATLAALHPTSGYLQVQVSLTCPGPAPSQSETFDVYVDPSGTLKDVLGRPIDGARVTLYAFDPVTLSLIAVPVGDARLSPANQENPDLTDAAGHFGWDVAAGAYVIRAAREGCVSPAGTIPYAQTGLLNAPFDMVDLDLRLSCAGDGSRIYLPVVRRDE
jgi:hypothetical protein